MGRVRSARGEIKEVGEVGSVHGEQRSENGGEWRLWGVAGADCATATSQSGQVAVQPGLRAHDGGRQDVYGVGHGVPVDRAGSWGADVLHGGEPGGDGHVMVGGHSHGSDREPGGARAHGAQRPRRDQVRRAVPRAGARGVRHPGRQCAVPAARSCGLRVVWDPDVDWRAVHLPVAQHGRPRQARRHRRAVVGHQRCGIRMLPRLLDAAGPSVSRSHLPLQPLHPKRRCLSNIELIRV